mgnify:CR=1 FL=1|tara:strand:+ start:9771 stop:10058 length:288 start_codon:yes stop_codon:yes gene_type:complete
MEPEKLSRTERLKIAEILSKNKESAFVEKKAEIKRAIKKDGLKTIQLQFEELKKAPHLLRKTAFLSEDSHLLAIEHAIEQHLFKLQSKQKKYEQH